MPRYTQLLYLLLACLLAGCFGNRPDKPSPPVVSRLDAAQYLGTWYEIARLDHSFERGLEQVSAQYSRNADGTIRVINRGYNPEKQKWQEAEGKAYFVDPANPDGTYTGKLRVSFFGPFYGDYQVIVLDQTYYNYALVTGGANYLWILSRTPQLTYPIKQELMAKAKAMGFATEALIHVNQTPDTREFKAGPHVNKP